MMKARSSVVPFSPSSSDLPTGWEALLEIGEKRSVDAGSTVLEDGSRTDRLYIVLEGQLKMNRLTPAGKNLILSVLGPGDICGVAGALGEATSCTSVEAVVPSVCLQIRRDDLYGLLRRQPELLERILPVLTKHLRECSNCLVESSCSKVATRLAVLFLRFADRMGEARTGGTFVPLPLARQDLADLAGTTLETAIRIMSRWGKDGWVETLSDGFLLKNRRRLEELALQ